MITVILSYVLNFCILAFLVMKFMVPAISKMMASKHEAIVQTLSETDKNLSDIHAQLDEYKQKMSSMEAEIANISKEAQERASKAAQKIKSDTVHEIEQLRQRVERQVAQEFANLKNEMRQEFVKKIVDTAQDEIQTQLNKTSHAGLIEQFAYSLKDFKEYKS